MLFRLLLSNVGFIVGVVIEAVLTVAAIVLIILVLKYGLPKFEPKERKPKEPKKAKPSPDKYVFKYVAGEGSGESPALEQYAQGAKIILKSNMFTAPTGKIFDGWSDGETKYEANKKYVMPNQAVTLTAQWVVPETKYTLRYVAGEGSGEAPMDEMYYKGEKVTLKTNMFETPTGKQFDGWWDGENKYASKFVFTMPAQSVTFTAQWADPKKEDEVVEVVEGAKAEPKAQPKAEPKKQNKEEVQEITVGAPTGADDEVTQQVDGGTTADGRPIVVNVYTPANTEKTIEKEVIHTVEKQEDDAEEDNMFANYTILELYGLLSDEQKRYFDTLKEAALAKPQAKLSAARNFLNIKIGKRSILKLRIRRLITVGEYALENDILKEFRKASDNKAGNAKIKVRPTLVAVTDDATLETALNMIDLVHKQILES